MDDLRNKILGGQNRVKDAIHSNFKQTMLGDATQLSDVLEKGKKANIGEIREHGGKKVKKIAEGKWQEVSEHGMTKKEHQEFEKRWNSHTVRREHQEVGSTLPDMRIRDSKVARKELNSKEYSDDEVHGVSKKIHGFDVEHEVHGEGDKSTVSYKVKKDGREISGKELFEMNKKGIISDSQYSEIIGRV